MPRLTRREFLKLAALYSAGASLPPVMTKLLATKPIADSSLPNIIVYVFDAMTARDLSVYDFPRDTTPNFKRFAERAIVYNSHYSAGNFTIPGTASLLTGMYPWTHRAINESGQVLPRLTDRNVFRLMGDGYNRYAYGQNVWADIFLNQFAVDLEHHLPSRSFGEISPWLDTEFLNDGNMGYRAVDTFLFSKTNPPASLLFGSLDRLLGFEKSKRLKDKDYPRGLPETPTAASYYRLADTIDGLMSTLTELENPYFGYFHIQAPHEPYNPTRDFYHHFEDDSWTPPSKPRHVLAANGDTDERVNARRLSYDRFIANLDDEFGRMLDRLEELGIRDNSYIILTADHGEMFERGVRGHSTPLLYGPVIHIPLLISTPGQSGRVDVHTNTSSVDVLPTLLHLAGQNIPDWCDGELLPELGGIDDPQRSIFSVEAKLNSAFAPLRTVSVAMHKGDYKITLYRGYTSEDIFEVYNLQSDPEEMDDLVLKNDPVVDGLRDELLLRLDEANNAFSTAN